MPSHWVATAFVFQALIGDAAASKRGVLATDHAADSAQALDPVGISSLTGSQLIDRIPTVDAVMAKATDTLTKFTARAQKVSSTIVGKQQLRRRILLDWKDRYEVKLRAQVSKVRHTLEHNMRLKDKVTHLEKHNKAVQSVIGNIRDSNGLMREALQTLLPKVKMAQEFLLDTINFTDTNQAPAIAILDDLREEGVRSMADTKGSREWDNLKEDIASKLHYSTVDFTSVHEPMFLQLASESHHKPKARRVPHPEFDQAERLAIALLQEGSTIIAPLAEEADGVTVALLQEGSALTSKLSPQADTLSSGRLEAWETANAIAIEGKRQLDLALDDTSQALSDADMEGQKAADRLKSEFVERYNKAYHVKERLLTEQASINSTCTTLGELSANLLTAQDFLVLEGKHLAENLHVLKGFMENVNKTVHTAIEDVERPDDDETSEGLANSTGANKTK